MATSYEFNVGLYGLFTCYFGSIGCIVNHDASTRLDVSMNGSRKST